MRWVSTRVLPDPRQRRSAAALLRVTAARCWSLSPSSSARVSIAGRSKTSAVRWREAREVVEERGHRLSLGASTD